MTNLLRQLTPTNSSTLAARFLSLFPGNGVFVENVMVFGMFGLRKYLEVLRTVIASDVVDVMDFLKRHKVTSEGLLHNETVFKHIPVTVSGGMLRVVDVDVPALVHPPAALPLMTGGAATLRRVAMSVGNRIAAKMATIATCDISRECWLTTATFTKAGGYLFWLRNVSHTALLNGVVSSIPYTERIAQ